ncbi:transcription antitermination protein NusB [Candidatus Woesebacteria bacterium]|nr:transcription antitermination protein NusB [Candidatus Woesebacteria bacterium]MCD8507260.1 transcription antitermination protein NusB [Candidatus Woesebacteria bacterium]MCD8526605.1 transcription antitermination protein NusB [Candidatus Woesebacteria bacterium]MCD8546000.1 transcription antitermination protein NusB [Candidatus Woesebacteria bacterium]
MSTAQDSRHQKRIHRIEQTFSWQFYHENSFGEVSELTNGQFADIEQIIAHISEFDELILKYAPKHDIETFNKIDLAILRQALYELVYTETPPAVVIDEAVEISKEYGSEETASFVHGVLGNVVDDRRKDSDGK